MPGGEFLLYWVAHHCWWGGQGVGLGILVLLWSGVEHSRVLNLGSSTHLYGMRLTAALYNGAVRGQPVDSHMIICHTSVTCERHSYICIYTTLGM